MTRTYYRIVEPGLFAIRKQRRLELLGVSSLTELPVALLDMAEHRDECADQCRAQIDLERRHLHKFLFADSDKPGSFAPWRAVPQVLDLDAYPDFASYIGKVARRGRNRGASGTRNIKKARALGYRARPIGRGSYYPEMVDIQASKLIRTGGPMLAAFPGVREAMIATCPGDDWYGCELHWGAIWGAFIDQRDAAGIVHEKLCAYCFMRRVGNRLHLVLLIGHADHLRNGVVPFLFAEIMKWLLDRKDPHIVGLRYFQVGAIEHGRPAYLEWKRRYQFQPVIYAWAPSSAPAD